MAAGDGAGAMIDHCFLTSTLFAYFPFLGPGLSRFACVVFFRLSVLRFPLPAPLCADAPFPPPPHSPPPLAPLFITRRIFLKRKRVCAFPNGSNEFFRLDLRLPFAWPRRRSTGQANLHDGAPLGIEFAADPNKL